MWPISAILIRFGAKLERGSFDKADFSGPMATLICCVFSWLGRSAATLHSGGGVAGGFHGIELAVLARLPALFHQPRGGRLDAEAPINGRHAKGEIRPADVGPVAP